MNVLSLFDGMSCGQLALQKLGIKVTRYFASEIDKYAIQVTQKNFPDTIQLGDVAKVSIDKDGYLHCENGVHYVGKIDLVIGGSPCQGFSFAGKQLNFDDPRSKLFFEFSRILDEAKVVNPDVKFLLENVRMKQEYQDVISHFIGVEPVFINSKVVSAQSRPRLYWSNLFIGEIKDRGLKLTDILEPIVDKKYYHTEAAIKYMNREISDGRTHWDFGHNSNVKNEKSQCLTATLAKGVPYNVLIDNSNSIRRFTPIECERLQTVPDNYTDCVSDSQRYKMLGNGWTVDIIVEFFKSLKNK